MWWQVAGLLVPFSTLPCTLSSLTAIPARVVACPIVTWSVMKLTVPKEGELFEKFNPELQKRNLEMRDERTRNYQEYLDQLQRYSKSDKPSMIRL